MFLLHTDNSIWRHQHESPLGTHLAIQHFPCPPKATATALMSSSCQIYCSLFLSVADEGLIFLRAKDNRKGTTTTLSTMFYRPVLLSSVFLQSVNNQATMIRCRNSFYFQFSIAALQIRDNPNIIGFANSIRQTHIKWVEHNFLLQDLLETLDDITYQNVI